MVDESEALSRILARAIPLEPAPMPLLEAAGMFLAEPIRARVAHPRFDNSTVDGYAVRAEDGVTERRIIGEQPAGLDRNLRLEKNESSRIYTGAPLPQNGTAVVMQEDVEIHGERLILREPVATGENIRRTGADVAAGQLIASAGDRLTPQLIGLLASQGMQNVTVHRRPRVTILSTGDELRPPGTDVNSGEIYESNSFLLAALLQSLGLSAEIRHSRDIPPEVESEIRRALESSDVLIISGGVSVGDHDHVRPALISSGVAVDLWRIRMKPGKPLAFGHMGEKLVFGLPGNPVSSFVTFLVMVRPALLQMLGARDNDRFLRQIPMQLDCVLENPSDRPHYVRGRMKNGRFVPQGLQESHALFGLSQSDALLRMEPGERIQHGDTLPIFVW